MIVCDRGVVCVMKQGIFNEFIGHGIHACSLFHVEHPLSAMLVSQSSEQMFHVEHSSNPWGVVSYLLCQLFHVEQLFGVVS